VYFLWDFLRAPSSESFIFKSSINTLFLAKMKEREEERRS
jgi:hypothetical protein